MRSDQSTFPDPKDAPPQAVIDSLYAASRALTADNRATVERISMLPIYRAGPVITLRRLSAMPVRPHANVATALAASEMNRIADDGGRRGLGGIRF